MATSTAACALVCASAVSVCCVSTATSSAWTLASVASAEILAAFAAFTRTAWTWTSPWRISVPFSVSLTYLPMPVNASIAFLLIMVIGVCPPSTVLAVLTTSALC